MNSDFQGIYDNIAAHDEKLDALMAKTNAQLDALTVAVDEIKTVAANLLQSQVDVLKAPVAPKA